MNMLGMEHGPEISMPGMRSSAGTSDTFQSPVLIPLAAGWPGSARSWRARWSTSPRRTRRAWTRGVRRSCRPTRNSQKGSVKSWAAPSTGANWTRAGAEAAESEAWATAVILLKECWPSRCARGTLSFRMAAERLSMAECATYGRPTSPDQTRRRPAPRRAWSGARAVHAPRAQPWRDRPRAAAQRCARPVGERAHHADVRAVGLLRGRPALRLLPLEAAGARSLGTAAARPAVPGPGPGGRAPAPPLRAAGMDRDGD